MGIYFHVKKVIFHSIEISLLEQEEEKKKNMSIFAIKNILYKILQYIHYDHEIRSVTFNQYITMYVLI